MEKMRKDIEIELSHGDDTRKLSAFNIYYANRDPKMAQPATAELANLFITENLEQRQKRSENTTNFLEDQLEQARAKLAEQEAKLRVFKDQHLGELPTQTQSNLQILAGLQNQVQANQDSLNRAKQQNTYLESLINQYRAMDRGSKPGETGGPAGAGRDRQTVGATEGATVGFDFSLHRQASRRAQDQGTDCPGGEHTSTDRRGNE